MVGCECRTEAGIWMQQLKSMGDPVQEKVTVMVILQQVIPCRDIQ